MRRSGRSLSFGTSVRPSTSRRPVPVKSWRRPRLTAWPRRKRAGGTPDPACAPALVSTGEHSIQAPGFASQAVMNLPCADQPVRLGYPLVIQPTRQRQIGGSVRSPEIERRSHGVSRNASRRAAYRCSYVLSRDSCDISWPHFWVLKGMANGAVCWVADKTGKVHSGEGKLL